MESQPSELLPNNNHDTRFPSLSFALPAWVAEHVPAAEHVFETTEERVHLAIEMARLNIEHGTGGPFGAAVFNSDTGQLVAVGVNIVVAAKWSVGHAEMVAMAIAQQVVQSHDLGGRGLPRHELVTSTDPCSMCFGATPWSGVKRLVCAATEDDAQAIGFDEGPKPADWIGELQRRGIEVTRGVLRDRAKAVLQSYASTGGEIYNGRGGK